MTHHPISQTWIDRWFQIVVVFKGIDCAIELVGGVALLAVPSHWLHSAIINVSNNDFVSDHDSLTKAVVSLGHTFTPDVQIYTAIYLLLHGVIKLGLVAALLSRRYKLYPAAVVVLVLFMFYQVYRIVTLHQFIFDGTLTLIDAVVVWLTILEYRRHTRSTGLPTA